MTSVRNNGVGTGSSAFWLFASAISVIVLGANTPLPLLTLYQSAWQFSTALLTVIYGLYTAGVLAAVFLLGPASDLVGRKRVLLPAIAVMAAGLVAGLLAQDVWTLMASRVLEGLAVGAGVTTAVAALGELSPDPSDHGRIALTATVATVLGLAGGPLAAGALAEFAPHPLQTPYLAALALCALVFAGVALSPETVVHRTRLRLRPVSVAVPKGAAGAFWLATLVELTAYAVAGSFAALGASFARDLLHIASHFAAGLVVALLFVCSAAGQIAARRLAPRAAMSVGLAVLIGGLLLFAFTLLTRSGVGLFLSAAVLGAGHGAAYLGSQELTDKIAPPDRRAQIFSAFQLGLYVGATAPALVIGFVAARTGLSTAALGFAAVVAGLALITLGWVRLGRSARIEPEPSSLVATEPST